MPLTKAGQEYASSKWCGSQRNPTPEQIEQALENGRRSRERHERRFAKWAKAHPEEAARIIEEQNRFAAATLAEQQATLAANRTRQTDEDRALLYGRPAVSSDVAFDGRDNSKQAA